MRRSSTYLVGVVLVFTLLATSRSRAQVELIVKLHESAPAEVSSWLSAGASKTASVPASLRSLAPGVKATHRLFPSASDQQKSPLQRVFVVALSEDAEREEQIDKWQRLAETAYVIPNRRYSIDTPGVSPEEIIDEPFADSLTHLEVTRIIEAWSITRGEPDIRIGFVDTGVYFDHPDLSNRFWINPGEDLNGNGRMDPADLNGIDDDGNGYVDDICGYDFVDRNVATELGDLRGIDPNAGEDVIPSTGPGRGHGTLVAGILGAAAGNGIGVAGTAPGSKLVPIRAFANDGEGEDDDVARAIVYASDVGVDVLNLSFGDVYYSPLMHDAIRYAVERGVVVVASAGNDGGDWPHYPSDYPEVIASGWLSKDGNSRGFRASHGANLDISAPATLTYTTLMPPARYVGSPETAPDSALYGARSGSSLAAPVIAGAAALLKSVDPSLSPASIQGILTASASDIMEPGWDQWTGAGRLDAFTALTMAYPAKVAIERPRMDEGIPNPLLVVTGSAIAPLFDSYALSVAVGDDEPDGRWETVFENDQQVINDTLGIIDLSQAADTTYMIRLAVRLKNGGTIEDRRRIYLDRTPPEATVVVWDRAIAAGMQGIFAEIATDDVSQVSMEIDFAGTLHHVESDRSGRIGRRHGLRWIDETGRGGWAKSAISIRNASGIDTTLSEQSFMIPPATQRELPATTRLLDIPGGYLMGKAADFDHDGLLELVYNKYDELSLGDTLFVVEWNGFGFSTVGKILANVFPRDVADTDGDGKMELLSQVSAVTLLLEQQETDELPLRVAFLDTTGISDIDNDKATWGTLLMDLDADGRGEILTHNRRAWRALEWDGNTYTESFRLENPTDPEEARESELDTEVNGFSLPRGLVADFDDDGTPDLLVGDADGDWIMYSCSADNTCASYWTYSTNRYTAGSRFATGDFDGDGQREFITYTDGWRDLRSDREYEAEYGIFYRFEAEQGGTYALRDSLIFAGQVSNQIGIAAADVSGDGRTELIVGYPPYVYVISIDSEWTVRYRWSTANPENPLVPVDGIRSIFMVLADYDGDGKAELVASTSAERMRFFDWSNESPTVPAPDWIEARALSANDILLAWRAPSADSVTVWRALPGTELDVLVTVSTDSLVYDTDTTATYALQAWSDGALSGLGPHAMVRPHAAAAVAGVVVEDGRHLMITFTEQLSGSTRSNQFSLRSGIEVRSATLVDGDYAVFVELGSPGKGRDTLAWRDLTDSERLPVGQDYAPLIFPDAPVDPLALVNWEALGFSRASLVFNKELVETSAKEASHYRVEPNGQVLSVAWSRAKPREVVLEIGDRALGATGRPTTVVVEGLLATDGSTFGAAGNVATFTTSAESLDDVFSYPNPLDTRQQGNTAVVAGLPNGSIVNIYGINGTFIRELEETDGNGGVEWDLRDNSGSPVPSGVYLIRVSYQENPPVLLKFALIR